MADELSKHIFVVPPIFANAASMEQASLTQRVAKLEKDLKDALLRCEQAEAESVRQQ